MRQISIVVLTVPEAAKRLRISRSKAYELIGALQIPYFSRRGSILVSEEQLDLYLRLAERPAAPSDGNQPAAKGERC
jgi:excisionase family DNA binding protein